MRTLSSKLQRIQIESGRRILAVSDIHGYPDYLINVLKKADFQESDILFIVGDMLERGPDSLGVLRYVMRLCERGNVFPNPQTPRIPCHSWVA